ncbi:MAG: ATP-binding cassette domain-containing protein [Deltaproteobacteria bacterium]|nr:ATP-binding cassette domain-containing protein [Deltaproteobacteria bacterium]
MTDSSNAMIGVEKLEKTFGTTRAVQGISFSVARGEVVGFLGPNGAGKTTTMRMLTGFLAPSGGSVRIGGLDVGERPLEARRKIGYLPESAPLYDEMMVVDFLHFVSRMRGVDDPKRLKEIADRCGILGVLGKDIGKLSKGYRQRVGLAQAMLHDPDLLVLDEPTSGLDPNQIVEIRDLIRELGKDKTVLLSTHILPEVQATCSRVLIINEGKLVADDTPDGLTDREGGAVVTVVLKAVNGTPAEAGSVQGLLAALPGVREARRHADAENGEPNGALAFRLTTQGSDDPREAIFQAAVKNDLVLLDLHREQVSLEDTFRKLTQGED